MIDVAQSKEHAGKLLERWQGVVERLPGAIVHSFMDAALTQGANVAYAKLLPYMTEKELDELYFQKREEMEIRHNTQTAYSDVVVGMVKDVIGLIYLFRQDLAFLAITAIK